MKRDHIPDLGQILWYTTGTLAALLFEVVAAYQYLNEQTIPSQRVTRICNALDLLQSIGAHPSTRFHFLRSQIPIYVYPFLLTRNECSNLEHLRIASLGIISALVKVIAYTLKYIMITY